MVTASILKKIDKDELMIDLAQKVYSKVITHFTFAWTIFVLFLIGKKKWKSPVGNLLISFIITKIIGLIIDNSGKLVPKKYPDYDYDYASNEEYIWSYALCRVVYYTCEIIGDWYLLIRTKALVKSNKKIKWVYVTCIIYNIAKLSKNYINYSYTPYKDNFDPERDEFDYFLRKVEHKRNKWICDLIQHILGTIYEITVIITLKRNVFVNYDGVTNTKTKGNFFIEKFKKLSIYRIYFTIILSLFCSPLIFLFCLKLLYAINNINYLPDKEKKNFYKNYCSDSEIESIRVAITNVSYALIYIDQVLLRHYSKESKVTVVNSSSNGVNNDSSTYNYSNENNDINNYSKNSGSVITHYSDNNKKVYNFSKIYHEINDQYENQNPINYKNNDDTNFISKSINTNNMGKTFKYDKIKVNDFNIENKYYKEKINYYDLTNNNNNKIIIDVYSNKNNNDNNNNNNYNYNYNYNKYNYNNSEYKNYYNSLKTSKHNYNNNYNDYNNY
ncbi:hypothetical protein BCR32DRAFT_278251 [Anaeromyces robustus]|uniref:Uncharacterized protein n=1 Tax=Anaeromyces robustus TaxID=1754192 RepID=A0A1Y1XBP4_9FUNG|nr:hypothetical protein BCR32DRAFT_278251 [Anaeromyces robustus]|eukprot:ORX83169.1 hypothetical protein BCR32DRAFT_278251 [Anaeromyces robustus]